MFRLKTAVVDHAQAWMAQEWVGGMAVAGSQDKIQMSCFGVLGILDQLLYEAADRSVAAQKITNVLDIGLWKMLDAPRPGPLRA